MKVFIKNYVCASEKFIENYIVNQKDLNYFFLRDSLILCLVLDK